MISAERREKIDKCLCDFNDEYRNICVDHIFCIQSMQSIIEQLSRSVEEQKDAYEVYGIARCNND